ncbi:hypothetical protein [Helicobacter cholecystus]|uniref:hypothetical protein n=1 Tax=Helicobacter cholecystus TaxID=45498 RepID=UPI002738F2C5|nr:hypothetical protein [Helicobacter cholecystus]
MKKTIPMMFCFDENYAIPASVAFYSLLYNNQQKARGGGRVQALCHSSQSL